MPLSATLDNGTPDVLGQLLQWGPAGVLVLLLLLGWLVPKASYEHMRADRDQWKAAFEREQEAHQTTRDALAEMSRLGQAAVETSRIATGLLERLGHPTIPPAGGRP